MPGQGRRSLSTGSQAGREEAGPRSPQCQCCTGHVPGQWLHASSFCVAITDFASFHASGRLVWPLADETLSDLSCVPDEAGSQPQWQKSGTRVPGQALQAAPGASMQGPSRASAGGRVAACREASSQQDAVRTAVSCTVPRCQLACLCLGHFGPGRLLALPSVHTAPSSGGSGSSPSTPVPSPSWTGKCR